MCQVNTKFNQKLISEKSYSYRMLQRNWNECCVIQLLAKRVLKKNLALLVNAAINFAFKTILHFKYDKLLDQSYKYVAYQCVYTFYLP